MIFNQPKYRRVFICFCLPKLPKVFTFLFFWGESARFPFDMGVSKNRGTPKSSILIGFSIINRPFWGTAIFGNTLIWLIFQSPKMVEGRKQKPLKSRPTKNVPPRNCQCYQEQLHGSAHLECSMQAALARNSR